MAESKGRKEVSLRFDWIELVGYMTQSWFFLLHTWSLYYFRSQVPYFFVIYIILPFIDIYLPPYLKNHSEKEQIIRERDWRFLIPLYSLFVCHWIELYAVFDFISYAFSNFSYFKILMTFAMLFLTEGTELIVGHELGHRKSCIHRFFGYLLYLRFLNTNFIITHNKGHHKWVATPKDPASSLKGQTLFQFAAHSIPHSFLMGWNIEVERIKKIYGPEVSSFYKVVLNQVFIMKLGELVYLGVVYYLFGFKVCMFALCFGLSQQMGLEIFNYIEHYGLRRKEIGPGKYERVNVTHSWNSSESFNNFFFFRLPRHSDHHETGSKPYQALQNSEKSPQLPFSYTIAFTLAMNPKLWFKAIDPLVRIYQEEKRLPTEKEAKESREIAHKAVYLSIVQNIGIMLLSLIA